MVVAIFTGHAPVRGHLYIMGLFDGDTAGWRLKQCSIIFAAARHWLVNALMSLGSCRTKRHKHGFSKGSLPLHTRHRVIESELNGVFRVVQ